MSVGLLGSLNNKFPLLLFTRVLVRGAYQTIANVVKDSCTKKGGLLTDQGHLLTKPSKVERGDVAIIQVHGALNRIVESFNQTHNSTLARAGGTDQSSNLASWDLQANIVHDSHFGSRRVDVLDIGQPDRAPELLNLVTFLARGVKGRRTVDGVEDLGSSSDSVGEGLKVGRNVSEVESTDHDSHENSQDVGERGLAVNEKLASLPESKPIVEVKHHHHASNHASDGTLDTETKELGLLEMVVILARKTLLGTKGDSVSDGANDLVGKTTSLGISFQTLLVILHDEGGTAAHVEQQGDNSGKKDQCQLPILDETNDESRDEGSERRKSKGNLFRNAILDEVGIRGDTSCDLAGAELVEEANVLSHAAFKVVLTNLG